MKSYINIIANDSRGEKALAKVYGDVKEALRKLVQEYFPLRLWDEVSKRLEKAYSILVFEKRYEYTRETETGTTSIIKSTMALRKGVEKPVDMKSLDGEIVTVVEGVPLEKAFHKVEISRVRMKCTCEDAVFTSSIADSRLEKIARRLIGYVPQPQLYRYVLCKHTLAELMRAVMHGRLDLNDKAVRETLFLSLYSLALRYASRIPARTHKKAIELLRRRHKW